MPVNSLGLKYLILCDFRFQLVVANIMVIESLYNLLISRSVKLVEMRAS